MTRIHGYRYTNKRHVERAARESARTTSDAWVTDGHGLQVARYRRGESGKVYRAS